MGFKNKIFAFLLLGLFVAPVQAFAQSTDVSPQVAALLTEVQALQAQIAVLEGQATSSAPSYSLSSSVTASSLASSSAPSCAYLPRTLSLGAKGSDVSALQDYLIANGYLDAAFNTGFYGSRTAAAVGKAQLALGLVSSADEGGFGMIGPKSRAKIGCPTFAATPPGEDSSSSAALAANPTDGAAALSVAFMGTGVTGGQQYIIDFGDGGNSGALAALDVCMHLADGSGGCPQVQTSHVYATAGTYTASLEAYIPCMWGPSVRCMIAEMPLARSAISVSGPTFSVSSSTSGANSGQ